MSYIDTGHNAYGKKCEWIGCGWDPAECDVHHIGYQEHQAKEDEASKLAGHKVQLPKDNRSVNLSVLCPNHHRFVHSQDIGMKLLQYIPPRK